MIFTQYARNELDMLPVEIIRRIAWNGPCSTALSLLQTCRKIHAAVDDWTVFHAIITNNANGSHKRAKWRIFPPDGSKKDFFARYAFADQVAAENLDSSSDRKLSTWAPQLTAMHRTYSKLLLYPKVENILTLYSQMNFFPR